MLPFDAPTATAQAFSIPFRCTSLSDLLGMHWRTRGRVKGREMLVIIYRAGQEGITRATGKRRVSQRVTLTKGQRPLDSDNAWKVLLDGLKHAGALIDDKPRWCETTEPEYERGPKAQTVITLEDVY